MSERNLNKFSLEWHWKRGKRKDFAEVTDWQSHKTNEYLPILSNSNSMVKQRRKIVDPIIDFSLLLFCGVETEPHFGTIFRTLYEVWRSKWNSRSISLSFLHSRLWIGQLYIMIVSFPLFFWHTVPHLPAFLTLSSPTIKAAKQRNEIKKKLFRARKQLDSIIKKQET